MTMAIAKPRVRVRAGEYAFPAGLPSRPAPSAGYMRSTQPIMLGWQPMLREASDDVKQSWRLATARAVETMQNSGFFAGGVDQAVAYAVGPNGLNLDAKPNAEALGWTVDEANEWAHRVEQRYAAYVKSPASCDVRASLTGSQQSGQAYRHWMATGEILATLPFIERAGAKWKTKLRVLPAWRMSSRSEWPDLVNGVRMDRAGMPVSYLMWRPIDQGMSGFEEVEVRARDSAGRRIVVHIFDGEPDQVRGISPLTPALKVTRQFDQLMDATLTTTLIQTVFAAMFKSSATPEQVLQAMQSESEAKTDFENLITEKASWYQKADLNLGIHGKIIHGFPGDELEFKRSEHPNTAVAEFARWLALEWSRVTALTYEEFTGDFSKATYSSIQMGTAANWPRVLWRRRHIVAPLEQARYEAWLEEDIESGGTPFPGGVDGFLENRELAATAEWRGPTKPRADDLKTAKAALTWKAVGVPDAVIFDELGLDVDDVYEQRKREKDRREQLGISDAEYPPGVLADDAQPPADDGGKPVDEGTKSNG